VTTTPEPATEPMLNTREIAEIFHASPKWVREQCASGRFPSHRIGRDYRMTAEQLRIAKQATLTRSNESTQPPGRPASGRQINHDHLRRQP
jgi:hypothetical protein